MKMHQAALEYDDYTCSNHCRLSCQMEHLFCDIALFLKNLDQSFLFKT